MLHSSLAIVICLLLCTVVGGCDGTKPATTSSSPAAQPERVATETARHVAASENIFDIMTADFDANTARKWAALLPRDFTPEDQQLFVEQMLRVIRSPEYRKDYGAILRETLTVEECERLAELLSDPVFKKFQANKADYYARMMPLIEQHFEKNLQQLRKRRAE